VGHFRTSARPKPMSAFPTRADISGQAPQVRFVPQPDMTPSQDQEGASVLRSWLCKKGGRPLNQPVGRREAYRIGGSYIKSVKCSLYEGRRQYLRRQIA
jgi:hypothetical protein